MIIFGAGVVGKALYYACQDKEIDVTAFCDSAKKGTFCGLPVIPLKDVDKYTHFIISVADIGDVVDQLYDAGYTSWVSCLNILKGFDPSEHHFDEPMDFVEYAIDTAITCHDYYNCDAVFLHSVDLIITERCSLRCKDCSNLMQYYDNPKDCDTTQLLKDIDALFDKVDFINEVRVLGGEPFMNKDWAFIVMRLIAETKLRHVVIYTNGTINPKDLQKIQSDKVLVLITDYGKLSKSISQLKWDLIKYGIPYYVQKASGWTSCSDISEHNRTDEENQALFKACCVHNLKTLSNGVLHKCPFEANLARLGYKFDDACDWCNGRPYGAETIEPAIQR